MEQTVMQELIENLEKLLLDNDIIMLKKIGIIMVQDIAKGLLTKEKNQIINSHLNCIIDGIEREGITKFTDRDRILVTKEIENYFDNTFKK